MAIIDSSSTCAFTPSVAHKSYERRVVETVFGRCALHFNVLLSDGSLVKRTDRPKFTLVINDRGIYKEVLFNLNDLTLGKAFIDKRIDVEGDLFEVMGLEEQLLAVELSIKEKILLVAWILLFL